MKQDKKGFTLIELLAVIVILAIIALIAVPTVMNIISKANKSAFKDSAYGIIKAGELYYADHLLEVNGMENDEEFIFPDNIANLQIKGSMPSSGNMIVSRRGQVAIAISNGKYCVRKGYTDNDVAMDEDIENCKTKEIANPISVTNINISEYNITLNVGEEKTITATIEPSNATIKALKWSSLVSSIATVDDSGKVRAIKKGTTIIKVETTDGSNINKIINIIVKEPVITSINECVKNSTICPNGTRINVKVNDSENYDFYVIKDTGTELTLIMDRNLGNWIGWINESDYIAAGGTGWSTTNGSTSKGPLTALKTLEERTSDWSNIASYTYTLTDDGGGNKYSSITRTNVKARMLKKTEANALGCRDDNNKTCPIYLYENLSGTNTEQSPSGYWLSSANNVFPGSIWYINSLGTINSNTTITGATIYGIRPVINISK